MFIVTKRIEFAGSHFLKLGYESPCERTHGHNWIVIISLRKDRLNDYGMVVDFSFIKTWLMTTFDHQNLNDILPQPTAENIAYFIFKRYESDGCFKVVVQESEGNEAIYFSENYLR